MKKFFYSAAVLALAFLAGSCQKETIEPAAKGNTVSFTVQTPGVMLTKASTINAGATIADGTNVNVVHYAVYKTDPNVDYAIDGTGTINTPLAQGKVGMEMRTIDGEQVNTAEIEFDLLQDQKYTVIFWSQVASDMATGMNDHYTLGDLRNITMNSTINANDESRAAFYAKYEFDTFNHKDHTVTLYRPFAQLNLLTTKESLEPKQEGETTGYKIDVKTSEVVVKGLSSTFNTVSGLAEAGDDTFTFVMADTPEEQGQETLTVNGTAYHYVSMNYFFVPEDEKLVNISYKVITDKGTIENDVPNVPVKENYRTNVIGNLLTKEATFLIIVDEKFNEPSIEVNVTDVTNSIDLEAALRQTDEHIVINLGTSLVTKAAAEPVEYEVKIGAWTEKYYFGGEKTKSITINANGNKINFVHENGDWNYIRCLNDEAKWIINDAILTNSGKNNGPWNRHDIRFYNAVELNNVTSDKAIAVLDDADLNNVTISEDGGVYGLWITADGQTVNIDGLEINAPNDGRGIAIKDEYVDTPALVTLNVKNAKFTTAKKAAVLVTSTAGAAITWDGSNDISGVAADKFNAVWVDAKRADYADLVSVNGCFKMIEEDKTSSVLEDIAEGNVTVTIPAGTYPFPTKFGENVTLNCEEGTVFTGTSGLNINGATVVGATFSNESGNAVGGTINGTFKDCTFEGSNALRYCYAGETVVFENCVFSGDVYGVHFDGGANDVIFRNCTFSGFNAFGSALTNLTFDGCTFKANETSGYNGANLWGKTELINTVFEFDGKASTEWIGLNATKSGKEIKFTGCSVKDAEGNAVEMAPYFANFDNGAVVNVDGVAYTLVEDSEGLKAALANADALEIILAEGTYEGTFSVSREVVLASASSASKSVIKGRFELINPNVTFKNVKFDYNDESKKEFSSAIKGNPKGHPAIVGVYGGASNYAVFENCDFNFKSGYSTAKAPGAITHYGDVYLKLDGCSLDGEGNPIYAKTNVEMTGCTVKMYGNNAILSLNYGQDRHSVILKNNVIENKSTSDALVYGMQFLSTNGKAYKNMYFDVQGNTGLDVSFTAGSSYTFENVTYAEGSDKL